MQNIIWFRYHDVIVVTLIDGLNSNRFPSCYCASPIYIISLHLSFELDFYFSIKTFIYRYSNVNAIIHISCISICVNFTLIIADMWSCFRWRKIVSIAIRYLVCRILSFIFWWFDIKSWRNIFIYITVYMSYLIVANI